MEEQEQKYFVINCHVNDRDVMIPICEELKKQKHYFIVEIKASGIKTSLKKISKKAYEKIINPK
jgi:hypothetical protein